jgi:hypothetical protein
MGCGEFRQEPKPQPRLLFAARANRAPSIPVDSLYFACISREQDRGVHLCDETRKQGQFGKDRHPDAVVRTSGILAMAPNWDNSNDFNATSDGTTSVPRREDSA